MLDPLVLFKKAYSLHSSNPREAIEKYELALPLLSYKADILYLLGTAYMQVGSIELGLNRLEQSLIENPKNPAVYNNIASALNTLGLHEKSINYSDMAILIKNNYAGAYNNRGVSNYYLYHLDAALIDFNKAIELDHSQSDFFNNRANVLIKLKRHEDSLSDYKSALRINPVNSDFYNNMGNLLVELRRFDEALDSFKKSINLKADNADAYSNIGNLFRLLNDFYNAIEYIKKSIEINPKNAEAFNNIANIYKDLGLVDESMAFYEKALELEPNRSEVLWDKSLLHILKGEYIQGWELYESRLKINSFQDQHYDFTEPRWFGQFDIANKKVFVYSEQGLGDVIQFCRYLPLVAVRCSELIVEVPEQLYSIMHSLDCKMTIIIKGELRPQFDCYCAIVSLPYAFKTTLSSIPDKVPYLYSDPLKVQNWDKILGLRKRFRVGLVWSGSEQQKNDRNRSIPLERFVSLLHPDVEYHSLQKEYRTHDIGVLNNHPVIIQHQDDLMDFSDTAALIDHMDLIISVCTSVAHVAGAMNKPVWILVNYSSDYRWLLDREDSPWYPSALLFRQKEIGDWTSVLHTIYESTHSIVKTFI